MSNRAKTNVDVNVLVEFFSFRIMLMPRIIIALNIIVTVLGVAALVCLPVAMIYFSVTAGDERGELIRQCAEGFVAVLFSMIGLRLLFEYLILFFRINETLTELSWKRVEQPAAQPETLAETPAPPAAPQAEVTVTAVPQVQPENEIRPGDIVFDCPSCGHSHAISPKGAGITINCVKCGNPMTVPPPASV